LAAAKKFNNTARLGKAHLGGAAHGIDDAGEFHQHAVSGGLDDAAVMLRDLRINQLPSCGLQAAAPRPSDR
jgi:hypothetical protein